MHIISTILPMRGKVSPAYADGKKIERADFVRLEAA
jgi:hypothetical protein